MLDLLYILYNLGLALSALIYIIATYTYIQLGLVVLEIWELVAIGSLCVYYKRNKTRGF
jgi:hypothetical protein